MESSPPAAHGRLLIAEDERLVALDLQTTLEDLGYVVVGTAASGEDAIEKARALEPSLILMDIRLAGQIDGVEAAERIRRERDVPIVFLTAHADDETVRRAKAVGPFGYLLKPFREPDLRCAVEIALHKHEADARVRERERWFSTTLHSIGDGVVATDAEGRITLLNPVAEALTGWKHEEAVGRDVTEVLKLVDEDGAEIASPLRQALADRVAVRLREGSSLVTKDGTRAPVDDSAAPILDDNGSLLGGVMVFRDITEQRRSADAIRRSNDELKAFNYSIAHDLRAPLRGIDGFSQALVEEHAASLGPEGVEHLGRVRAAASRMGHLIDDLLRLSRAASAELVRRQVDVSYLVRSVRAALSTRDRSRSVEMTIENDLTVDADERLLMIVFENLLGNAWKFTARKDLARIEVGSMAGERGRVIFVRDNGAGFDSRYAAKLFAPFQRLHSSTEFEGTGIGLAIVHRIITRHGGRVWAQGAVGQGATFLFTLGEATAS